MSSNRGTAQKPNLLNRRNGPAPAANRKPDAVSQQIVKLPSNAQNGLFTSAKTTSTQLLNNASTINSNESDYDKFSSDLLSDAFAQVSTNYNIMTNQIKVNSDSKPAEKDDEESQRPLPVIQTFDDYKAEDWKQLIKNLMNKTNIIEYAQQGTNLASLDALKEYLSKAQVTDDVEKAWLIYVWIGHHIKFNANGFFSGNYGDNSAENVFKSGQGVCAGYSHLFIELCSVFKLDCYKVSGFSKGLGYKIGQRATLLQHAWVAIKCSEKWRLIEITWSAGSTQNSDKTFHAKFEPYWFFVPPSIFISDHFPKQEVFQLLKDKISPDKFMALPKHELQFYMLDLKCLSDNESAVILAASNPLNMEFSAPKSVKMTANLYEENKETVKIENCILIQRSDDSTYRLKIVFPNKMKRYVLRVFAGLKPEVPPEAEVIEPYKLDGVTKYLINPNELKQEKLMNPMRFVQFFDIRGHDDFFLECPVEQNLRVNKAYEFKLQFKDAFQVALLTNSDSKLHQLTRTGDSLWSLTQSFPQPDTLKLLARFNETELYKAICIYNLTK